MGDDSMEGAVSTAVLRFPVFDARLLISPKLLTLDCYISSLYKRTHGLPIVLKHRLIV